MWREICKQGDPCANGRDASGLTRCCQLLCDLEASCSLFDRGSEFRVAVLGARFV